MWFVQSVAFSGVGATIATEAIHGVVSASITNSASVTTNVTLYHINPLSYSAAPVDMDLGDVAGDLYFDISQVPQAFSFHGNVAKALVLRQQRDARAGPWGHQGRAMGPT